MRSAAATSKTLPSGTRMIKSKDLAASLTCYICFKIHRKTISIGECMHSYCKRCILPKILEEDLRCCPACGIDLGPNPLSTLKRDPHLQSLVSNIFHSIEKNIKEDTNVRDWDLNCPAEPVDDTMKNSEPRSQGIVIRTPPSTVPKEKPNFTKAGKSKQCVNTSNVITIDDDEEEEEEKDNEPPPPAPPVPKPRGRPRGSRQKKPVAAPSSEGVRISPQAVVDATASKRRLTSVWLQLVATYKRNAGPPLRQIPSRFWRINDIHATVLGIKKHIVQKLGLQSEEDVEIEMREGLVLPDDMKLYSVMNLWASPEKVTINIGSSAKDFIMSLRYSRKA